MAKSNSCFPTFRCLKKKSVSTRPKLRTNIRMPTLREFLNNYNNASTQTDLKSYDPPNTMLYHTKSLTNSIPKTHRSTIAIRRDKSFIPITSFEKSKVQSQTFNKVNSPDDQTINCNSLNATKNNTLFMSRGSFDEFFAKVESEYRLPTNKDVNPFEVTEEKMFTPEKKSNPFVVSDSHKPKIIAITPVKNKKSYKLKRPNIKINLRPVLTSAKDCDYLCSSSRNHLCNMNFRNDLEDINLLK